MGEKHSTLIFKKLPNKDEKTFLGACYSEKQ